MSVKGVVTNISKGSLHDGPGVRTVVYLKGCGLRCKWCHNPETLKKSPEVLYAHVKCIHCGKCIEACPDCHSVLEGEMIFSREKCTACGKCTEVCPTGAFTMCGEEKTVDDVFSEIVKDRHYYEQSGGGVTLSGGECLLCPDFTAEILRKCKSENIHTAVETALFVPWENVERVIPYVDLFFADLKIPEREKHKKYTGQDNSLIIENLKRLSEIHDNIIIRIPLIPGVNDTECDMRKFSEIIKNFGKGIKDVELLKYNYLASSKYTQCGMEYHDFGEETQSDEYVEMLKKNIILSC